jgi:serine/threonine protein kinase
LNGKKYNNALQVGHKIHWYVIQSILGQGSFGITYLAHDTNLDRMVAIKEFLPTQLAMRSDGVAVLPVSDDVAETYQWGLSRFVNEARTLAKFHHPNIIHAYSVFESNNTAYMVMEYESGDSLSKLFDKHPLMAERDLLKIWYPLLNGIELVHDSGFVHRDIKPDNIYLRKNGLPVVLDFGSARQAVGAETRAMTTLVSPGYAPFEQYNSTPDSDKQGPWTDIYALGATLYRGVCGRGPIDALSRANALLSGKPDVLISAAHIGKEHYSQPFLQAIDNSLKFLPEDRPQSISEWRTMFLDGLGTIELDPGEAWGSAPLPQHRFDNTLDDKTAPPQAIAARPDDATVLVRPHAPDQETQWASAASVRMDRTGPLSGAHSRPATPLNQPLPRQAEPMPTPAHEPDHPPVRHPINKSAPVPVKARGRFAFFGSLALLVTVVLADIGVHHLRQRPTASPTADSDSASNPIQSITNRTSCSAIHAADINGSVQLTGYSGHRNVSRKLKTKLMHEGKQRVRSDIIILSPADCMLLDTYKAAWNANYARPSPAAMATSNTDNTFASGEQLVVDIVTPDYPSHLYIDYFLVDGNVVHMLPSSYFESNQAGAVQQATIGDMGEWQVAPPFGRELIVMLSSSIRLFNEPREEVEDSDDYLKAVGKALERISADPSATVSANFLLITTKED